MNERDYIGKRGETIFTFLITRRCDGRFWLDCTFQGEKAEAKDFIVNLIDPGCGEATFFVQVKATTKGYTGKGPKQKLRANVSKKDIQKLKQSPGPTFVAGIDVELEVGFLVAITDATGDRLSGIPCTHQIDCTLIKGVWQEVEQYWTKRNMLAKKSMYS
jgi:hypothetical protein